MWGSGYYARGDPVCESSWRRGIVMVSLCYKASNGIPADKAEELTAEPEE
jgi:hypothetical protein